MDKNKYYFWISFLYHLPPKRTYMSEYQSEAEIEAELYEHFKHYIQDNDTPFEEPTLQQTTNSGKRSDIYIKSLTKESVVIEVKSDDDDKYLLDEENIKQARNYAEEYGHSTFILTNSKDLFLFDYDDEYDISEIDNYYLNLRKYNFKEIPSKVLAAVEELYENGKLPEQKEKEQIIGILRTFHSHTYPTYKKLIEQEYAKNREFKNKFDTWVEKNDYTGLDKDEQIDVLAKQHTYALTNRLLFYKVLRDNNIGEEHGVILDEIDIQGESRGLQNKVEAQFNKVTENINYEPIFNIEDDIFELIPHSKRTDKDFKQLLKNFRQFNLTDVEEDLIGELYEELIPSSERKKLGQFYTPAPIAETITKWTLSTHSVDDNKMPRVLDPACGSRTFPVEVYKELENKYDSPHQDIIDNISVCDINRFPLHLTGINLTSQNITESTNHIDSTHGSFFDYPEPEEKGKFDAVVGNPPYINSKRIPNKDAFREHLKQYNPDGNKVPEYHSGTKEISKRSDAFVYFVTNAMRYLKDGGRLGFIIPSVWMDTKYGVDFRQFLFDNTKIKSVISFSSRVFEDADVNSCILLLEKCSVDSERNNNTVDFINVNKSIHPDDLVSAIEFQTDINGSYNYESLDSYNVYTTKQNKLKKKFKWSQLLNTPENLINLFESENVSRLGEFADVSSGIKTGGLTFFCPSEEEINSFGIEDKFLEVCASKGKHITKNTTAKQELDEYIINIQWFVEKYDIGSITELKDKLEELSYTGILRYIEYGEEQEYHTNNTMKRRDIWCELDGITKPDIIHRKMMGGSIQQTLNNDNIVVTNNYYCINIDEYNDKMIYSILNSYSYNIIIELYSQKSTGSSIELQARTVRNIPFLNLDALSEEQEERLEESYENILNDEYQGIADEVVLELLGMEDELSVDELESIQKALVKARVEGVEPEVLLDKGTNEEAGAFDEFV